MNAIRIETPQGRRAEFDGLMTRVAETMGDEFARDLSNAAGGVAVDFENEAVGQVLAGLRAVFVGEPENIATLRELAS